MSNSLAIASTDAGNGNDDLLNIVRTTAMNVNSISEQMGLINTAVNEHTRRIVALESRLDGHERTETINRAQGRQMKRAVLSRVRELLEIKLESGKVADESIETDVLYTSGFRNRLYFDAKTHSKMGETYPETLRVDFDEVMQYISSWYPEGVPGGVDGYKRYLDIRRDERIKHSA